MKRDNHYLSCVGVYNNYYNGQNDMSPMKVLTFYTKTLKKQLKKYILTIDFSVVYL